MRRLLAPIGLMAIALLFALVVLAGPSKSPSSATASHATIHLTAAHPTSVPSDLAEGQTLFEETCSSCHGADATGGVLAPNLQGVGTATVDLWVSSGWMPLAVPTDQPVRKPALFNQQQTVAIANFIESLRPGGYPIPSVDLKGANVSQGESIFALNCAPCHTITGAGDALSNGLVAPPLHGVTATQVWEAVRTGPGNMPRFASGTISKSQLADLTAFVTKDIEHPDDVGGLGLGGVGPVAEGFIGLFVGVGACMLIALWIGDRSKREDEDETHHEQPESAHV